LFKRIIILRKRGFFYSASFLILDLLIKASIKKKTNFVAVKQIQKQMPGMLGVNLQIFDYYSVIGNFGYPYYQPTAVWGGVAHRQADEREYQPSKLPRRLGRHPFKI